MTKKNLLPFIYWTSFECQSFCEKDADVNSDIYFFQFLILATSFDHAKSLGGKAAKKQSKESNEKIHGIPWIEDVFPSLIGEDDIFSWEQITQKKLQQYFLGSIKSKANKIKIFIKSKKQKKALEALRQIVDNQFAGYEIESCEKESLEIVNGRDDVF